MTHFYNDAHLKVKFYLFEENMQYKSRNLYLQGDPFEMQL